VLGMAQGLPAHSELKHTGIQSILKNTDVNHFLQKDNLVPNVLNCTIQWRARWNGQLRI